MDPLVPRNIPEAKKLSRVKHFTPEIPKCAESKNDIQNPITGICFCDLYVVGTIWIEAMKYVLVGSKFDVFPPVKAAAPQEPRKPAPMKYKDLPLVATPHVDYKEHKEKLEKCPHAEVKLLHDPLYPTIRKTRRFIQNSVASIQTELADTYKEVSRDLGDGIEKTKCYFRDPNNKPLRQGVVAVGGLTGLIIARKKSIFQKVIFTSLGTLAGGFLAYPEETDVYFRTFLKESAKQIVCLYNSFNKGDLKVAKSRPCFKESPLKTRELRRCEQNDNDGNE